MKEEILKWFKHSRELSTGITLYLKYGKNKSLKRELNSIISSQRKLDILFEEFRKMLALSFPEFNKLIARPVRKLPKPKVQPKKDKDSGIGTGLTSILNDKNKEQQAKIKLREEFPFLSDPDCPDVFKILVADKITAYHTYVKRHPDLFTASTPQEQFEAVRDVVENYIENRDLYKELNYFKKHKEILGDHFIFKKFKRLEELKKLSTEELVVRKDNLKKYVRRYSKAEENLKKPERVDAVRDKLELYSWELEQVERMLKDRS